MAEVQLNNIRKLFGEVIAVDNADFTVEDSSFLVLVGPSGCGKSTILRIIAGLEDPTSGEVLIDGNTVTRMQPKDRDVAMVFQSYALYPHMTVSENMSFGLRVRGISKAEIEPMVRGAAETLGISNLLERKPAELSGGQKQRVALGRAIVRDPKVFLFDEPLSNLDAKFRLQLRSEIKRLHEKLKATTIYVTHDQVEAMTLGDKIVVMEDGRIHQIGTPSEVFNTPRNIFVGGFIGSSGMNFLEGTIDGTGSLTIEIEGAKFPIPPDPAGKLGISNGERIVVGIRPDDIFVIEGETSAPHFRLPLNLMEILGGNGLLYLQHAQGELTAFCSDRFDAKIGDEVPVGLTMDKAHYFDPDTGENLLS